MTGATRQERKRLWDEGPEAHQVDRLDRAIAGIGLIVFAMVGLGLARFLLW